MQHSTTDVARVPVSLCVCASVFVLGTHMRHAKTDKPIEMTYRRLGDRLVWAQNRNYVLDGNAHLHHLANTIN